MDLKEKCFREVNIDDPFFDSLKQDYKEFSDWFAKKAEELAYVFYDDEGAVNGFLYLKYEGEEIDDVDPALPEKPRIKIGTFKINPHGTRIGERFIKKIFDHAVTNGISEIYTTVFKKHEALIDIFSRYGFRHVSDKVTDNGTELVLLKKMKKTTGDIVMDYPLIQLAGKNTYLLSIYPRWHTRLLPDSILRTEESDIIQDISHTNSIHKVYLASMQDMERLKRGDVLVIYRTTDKMGPAYYRSVATSICVLEDYRPIHSFKDQDEFFGYCRPYSVFTEDELISLWRGKRYQHVIRFTYNLALTRRPNRKTLIEEIGLPEGAYWGFLPITHQQLKHIVRKGNADESLIVD